MRFVLFCHSLLSDWNHGNAHFLRGVTFELRRRGHEVEVYEPENAWSLSNLLLDHGPAALSGFRERYPGLESTSYALATLDLDRALEGADVVIVHEWNEHELVRRIGEHKRARGKYALLFHDTHHRVVTEPEAMARYDLRHYDGVLAFGQVLTDMYLKKGLTHAAWTFHEAADPRVFSPLSADREGDLVWVGNWGDDERTEELHEFLLGPTSELGLATNVYGVRYPESAKEALARAGASYRGWLANYRAPEVFARHLFTVHVPRRPYVKALVGVPTIRVFEALACGIPLVSAPWDDAEGLFTPGKDFLFAENGAHMTRLLRTLKHEPALREQLAKHGLETIRARHTCAHRVDELMNICLRLGISPERDVAQGSRPALQGESCPT